MLDRLRWALERRLAKLIAGPQNRFTEKQISTAHDVRELQALGNQHLANGDLSEAERCFRQALHFNATNTDILTCLGYTLKELHRYAEARIQLHRAIVFLGNASDAYEATYLMGQVAEADGDLQYAQAQYLDALRLKPDFPAACSDLCRLYKQMGDQNSISQLLIRCIALCPQVIDYRYAYSNWLLEKRQYAAAIDEFDKLIALKPDFAEAHNNRGIALQELNRNDEAIESFTLAIQLTPDLPNAHSNRGASLMKKNQFASAIVDFKESIRLSPKSAIPYINLGEALRETQQLNAAIIQYDMAQLLDPTDRRAYWNKALALLLSGKLTEGFALFEYRFNVSREECDTRDFAQPHWLGNVSLEGKTILIHCEQGLGDTIQFCRYVPMVAAMGARVILEVQKPLLRLLQSLDGLTQIFARGDLLPSCDYHCSLMSLPHAFNTDENSIPWKHNYISVDTAQKEKWSQKLGAKSKPLIGIAWSGNAAHKNDHNRSIELAKFIEILPSCYRYITLQKEVRPSDKVNLDKCPWIERFDDALIDFTETAALCDLMDIVISVDTSVAHLAATLGKPTWILLPYSGDWRWMLNRTDSLWYPSARLYRQENSSEWDDVLQRVKADLRVFLNKDLGGEQ